MACILRNDTQTLLLATRLSIVAQVAAEEKF